MAFEQDLFISYAHIDNEPIPPFEGWISRFHETLEAFVSMRLGGRVNIWRDGKLSGNDVFSDEIIDQFQKTAILVSILSPRYVQSEWCSREMHEFCEVASQSLGVVVDNKSRVFKVVKTPVEGEETLPEIARQILGYEFYKMEKGKAPLELDPAFGEEFAQAYNRKVGQLAWDIKELLEKLRSANAPAGERREERRPRQKVFLAECSYNRAQEREKIESELKAFGCRVVPSAMIPKDEEGHRTAVRELLADCDLSVHLIGDSYGAVPDGPSRKSGVVIQNEIAAEFSRTNGLKRLIWLPETTQPEDQSQSDFVEALHADEEAQFGADLITGDFEHFKTSIHSSLKALRQQGKPMEHDGNTDRLVYLICNQADRKQTVALRKWLRQKNIDVETPAFEGDAEAVRKANETLLAKCSGLIVYYGSGSEAWKRSIDDDLKKMFAYREGRELKARITYLADPPTADKEDLIDMEEPDLVTGYGKFEGSRLSEFVDSVTATTEPS